MTRTTCDLQGFWASERLRNVIAGSNNVWYPINANNQEYLDCTLGCRIFPGPELQKLTGHWEHLIQGLVHDSGGHNDMCLQHFVHVCHVERVPGRLQP